MGLERRKNGMYYYRKRRVGNKVISEYAGAGAIAGIIATLEQNKRERATFQAETDRAEQQAVAEPERYLLQQERTLRLLMAEHMNNHGYHNHKGTWRKRRTIMNTQQRGNRQQHPPQNTSAPTGDRIKTPKELTKQEIDAKVFQVMNAINGASGTVKKEDIAAFHQFLDAHPEHFPNMSDTARNGTLQVESEPQNVLMREMNHRDAERLRKEFRQQDAPVLESIMIEHVIACHLSWGNVLRMAANVSKIDVSIKLAEHWDKRLTTSQNRYVKAVAMLHKLRTTDIQLVQIEEQREGKQERSKTTTKIVKTKQSRK